MNFHRDISFQNLVQQTVNTAIQKKITIALAESCAGGHIADLITNVPGASEIFFGSWVVYSNEMKTRALGVSQKILDEHGAVSAECAAALWDGVKKNSGAHFCAAVTGIAGPGGGTPQKPVGTVFVATGTNSAVVEKFQIDLPRLEFKEAVAKIVLERWQNVIQFYSELSR